MYMNNNLKSMRKIPIENVLLPKYVEVAKQQIRMFEKEGEVLSSEYTNWYKKGEVDPNSTKDNGEGKVTVALVTFAKVILLPKDFVFICTNPNFYVTRDGFGLRLLEVSI